MSIYDHAETFAGRPVEDFDPDTGLTDPKGTAYALRSDYEGPPMEAFIAALLGDPNAGHLEALVIGVWPEAFDNSSAAIVESLVAAKETLGSLRALFLGDITGDECEISWISQSDVSPLLAAFPKLEVLHVRGGNDLALSALKHGALRELVIETGGLSGAVVEQIATAHLPNLDKLDLWLGTENYGGDTTLDQLAPILSGKLFPKLRHLGLKNTELADTIAQAITGSPVLGQLQTLDLSMGTMTDAGAQALVQCAALGALQCLDLSDNYISEPILQRLREANVALVSTEQGDPDDSWRYTTVSE